MVIDGENTFFWNESLSSTAKTSKPFKTGRGDATKPLFFVANAQGASADMTITIETAKNETFTTPVTVGTYTIKKGKLLVTPLPYGDLGYLRAKTGTESSTGKISAYLTMDAELH